LYITVSRSQQTLPTPAPFLVRQSCLD